MSRDVRGPSNPWWKRLSKACRSIVLRLRGRMPSPTGVDINGEQPDLVGLVCEALVAIEYSHAGVVVEPANQIFLRFASQWHLLYFDFGIVFWRTTDDVQESYVAEELDASFRADDIGTRFGLVGLRVEAVRCDALVDGSRVTLQFERGRQIQFECRMDVTTYSA